MPLTATDRPPIAHDHRKTVGVWMQNESGSPIRVFVTYEALWQSDPSQVRDVASALAIFDASRAHLENLASARFDANGADDSENEG